MIVDAGPFIADGDRVNSRLWALVKCPIERLGTFVLTADADDFAELGAPFERY